MAEPAVPAVPGVGVPADGASLQAAFGRIERARKMRAAALTLPLLLFLAVTFVYPIGALLFRAIHSPEIVDVLPRTAAVLERL